MARDKAKDDKHFNCTQTHENDYVSGLYGYNKDKVSKFLTENCKTNAIKNSTHKDVYELIYKKLGYPVPN